MPEEFTTPPPARLTHIAAFPAEGVGVSSTGRMGALPQVEESARIRDSRFGVYTSVGARTRIAESVLDDYSYIVEDGDVIYCTIGKFCSIAAAVRLNPGNHPTWRASQHHFSYRSASYDLAEEDDADFFNWRRSHPVTIGHDVWIGHAATIMPGVTVGTGAVIGAGAVVTKDVDPYRIVAGVPARPIRDRFPPEQAKKLMALAWWDWPHDKLRGALSDFRLLSVPMFLEKYSA